MKKMTRKILAALLVMTMASAPAGFASEEWSEDPGIMMEEETVLDEAVTDPDEAYITDVTASDAVSTDAEETFSEDAMAMPADLSADDLIEDTAMNPEDAAWTEEQAPDETSELHAAAEDEEEDDDDGDEDDEEEADKEPEEITMVQIDGVSANVNVGRKPKYTAEVSYGNVTVTREYWRCDDLRENSSGSVTGIKFNKFEDGHYYTYGIQIAANDSDYFSENTVVSVNGRNITSLYIYPNMILMDIEGVFCAKAVCAHEYMEKTEEATCTADGREYKKCKYCGDEIFVKKIAATGHQLEENEDKSVEPTCTSNGCRAKECENCGMLILEPIPATGHKLTHDEDESVEATCTAEGRTVYSCENDGCTYKRVTKIAPLGHAYGLHVVKKASATKEGSYYYGCTRDECGAVLKRQTVFPYKKITLSKTSFACTGSPIKPSFKVYDSLNKVIPDTYYSVVYYNNKNVGTATVHLTFSGMYSGTMTATYKIKQGSQSISVNAGSYTFKKADLKKKAASFDLGAKAQTKLSYSTSNSKYVTVSGGKVKVKKGTPKGTYTVTVKAASTKNFKAASRKVTIKVK